MNEQQKALLEQAEALDHADDLSKYRKNFHFPLDANEQPVRYFCGHSLGLQPKQAMDDVLTAMHSWRDQGVDGHFQGGKPWLSYLNDINEQMATLVGAEPSEVTVMNALTVNLHFLLASFFRPKGKRNKIIIEESAFPSDRYAVISQLKWHGLDPDQHLIEIAPHEGERLIDESQLESLLAERGEEIALVMLPGVQYITGQLFDISRITKAAHQAGAIAGFDLAHATGNLPLQLHDSGADFAAWCGYKYLNGGPGTLSGCFIHSRHHDNDELVKLAGWWSNAPKTRFNMADNIDWASGADAWQVSNPPILSSAPLITALSIHNQAGISSLRNKSLALTGYLEKLLDALMSDVCEIITPRDTNQRGCQLSLRIFTGPEAGQQLYSDLRERGFICDWRFPDIMRIAPVPMYNSFVDVRDLITCMHSLAH